LGTLVVHKHFVSKLFYKGEAMKRGIIVVVAIIMSSFHAESKEVVASIDEILMAHSVSFPWPKYNDHLIIASYAGEIAIRNGEPVMPTYVESTAQRVCEITLPGSKLLQFKTQFVHPAHAINDKIYAVAISGDRVSYFREDNVEKIVAPSIINQVGIFGVFTLIRCKK
jgi:hypothetical protein